MENTYFMHEYRICESTDFLSFTREVDCVIDGLSCLDYDLQFSTCFTADGILYTALIILHYTYE